MRRYRSRFEDSFTELARYHYLLTEALPGEDSAPEFKPSHIEQIGHCLSTAVYGIGVYFGAGVHTLLSPDDPNFDPNFHPGLNPDFDNTGRILAWKHQQGQPVELEAEGTATPDKLNAAVELLNEVDLGSNWWRIYSAIRDYEMPSPDEIGFIVRTAEEQKSFFLFYNGALICSILDDLERVHQMDTTAKPFVELHHAYVALRDASDLRKALLPKVTT